MSYNYIINHISKKEDEDVVWKFKGIAIYEGPLNESHTNYIGYRYIFMFEW